MGVMGRRKPAHVTLHSPHAPADQGRRGLAVARGKAAKAAWKSKNRDPAAVSGKITEYLAF